MLRRSEPRKSLYSPYSSIANDQEIKYLFNKKNTVNCSYSSTGENVIKQLQHIPSKLKKQTVSKLIKGPPWGKV
jgi:hypothetical protein